MKDDDRRGRDERDGKLLSFRRRRPAAQSGSSPYDEAFEKAAALFSAREQQLKRERLAADRLIERLVELPAERRQLLIDNSPRFQAWGLAERLIEEGQRHVGEFGSSSQLDLMQSAVAIAIRLNPRIYGRYHHHDLQATALAQLGNALRVVGRYDSAAVAFASAHRHLDLGTGSPIGLAQLESLEVSLLNGLARFDSSLALANRALARLPQPGGGHLRVQLLHQRAVAEPDPERAITGFEEVLDQTSAEEQPLVAFVALQGLSAKLAAVGRVDEGNEAVVKAGRLVHHAKQWGRIHLEWSSAALAACGGEMTTAAGILSGLWLKFSARPVNDGFFLTASLELVDARAASDDRRKANRLAEKTGDLLVQRDYPAAVLQGWAEVRRQLTRGRIPRLDRDAGRVMDDRRRSQRTRRATWSPAALSARSAEPTGARAVGLRHRGREGLGRFAAQQGWLVRERAAAEQAVERLVEMPYERRRLLIEEGRRLCDQIDASPGLDLPLTAVLVADQLDPRLYGRSR